MNLIIFTMNYPYNKGEDFLENEIKIAEKVFDKIAIISLSKKTSKVTKYIPQNSQVFLPRCNIESYTRFIHLIKCLFHDFFWSEVFHGCNEIGFRNFFSIFIKTLLTEDAIKYLNESDTLWEHYNHNHCINYSYWLDAPATYLARKKAQLNGICISRAHGQDCFFDRGYHPYRIIQLNKLDFIFPISKSGAQDIVSHFNELVPYLKSKVIVKYLGVKLNKFNVTPYKKKIKKLIVSCSNIVKIKRLDIIINALSRIDKYEIKWIHFGNGELMHEMKVLAKKRLGEKTNIEYEFYGNLTNDKIINFYANNNVDAFINCSDVEGIPVSMMEAMSYGIPCIARDIGGISELLDNSCGILLNNAAYDECYAQAIDTLFSMEEEKYLQIRINAQKKVLHCFSAEKNYVNFFEFLIKG